MRYSLVVMALICVCSAPMPAAAKAKQVGWIENVRIKDIDLHLKAKMDTGATTSSIDAEIIDIKKIAPRRRGFTGETAVFSMTDDDGARKKVFERHVVRYVRIKKKDGGYIRRPVVEMTFCIAGHEVMQEVNLADRGNFLYPVLVGRNMLSHAELLVDASRTFLTRPTCR
jgi:hypothetical protein